MLNVFSPFAQRRNADLDGIDSIIEIFPQTTVLYRIKGIAICRGYQTEVCFLRFVATKAIKNTLLENTKQLWLELYRQFADFVQQKTSVICAADQADLVHCGARKRSLCVPKQLRLDQFLRKRRAVDFYKGFFRSKALVVNRVRD